MFEIYRLWFKATRRKKMTSNCTRAQDLVCRLQKDRSTIKKSNHFRLWSNTYISRFTGTDQFESLEGTRMLAHSNERDTEFPELKGSGRQSSEPCQEMCQNPWTGSERRPRHEGIHSKRQSPEVAECEVDDQRQYDQGNQRIKSRANSKTSRELRLNTRSGESGKTKDRFFN